MKCSNTTIPKLLPLYEAGLLNEDQKREVEKHLMNCAACAEDLYTMQPVIETIINYMAETEREQIDKGKWIFIQRWAPPLAAAVATLVLSLIVYFGGMIIPIAPSNSTSNIYKIFNSYETKFGIQIPGRNKEEQYQIALELFEKGKYKESLSICKRLHLKKNNDFNFLILAARSYLALEQPDRALTLLSRARTPTNISLKNDILWLKAQSFLKLNKKKECIKILKQLVASSPRYKTGARKILNLLQ